MSSDATPSVDHTPRSLCDRLQAALGRPLRYVDADDPAGADSSPLWTGEVRRGDAVAGRLLLEPVADGDGTDDIAGRVLRLLDVVVELANERHDLEHRFNQQQAELAALLAPGGSGAPDGRSPDDAADADVGDVLRLPLESLCRLTGFRSAAFFLFDPPARRLVLRREYHRDPRDVPGPIRLLRPDCPDWTVLTEGHVVIERADTPQAGLWLPGDAQTGVGVRVPCGSGPLGTLWAFDRRRRELSTRERQVFDSIAAQTGGLLEREALARQWQQSARIRSEVGTAAANMAADVLADIRGRVPFDIAGFCTSCSEIGGDLCEVVPLSPTRTVIAIGDASGHGVAAALVMHAARGALRGALDAAGPSVESVEPVAVLSQVNRALCQVTPPHQFMSLLVGVLDTAAMGFEYANAGHPCPLHVRGDQVEHLESHGMLTGVMPETDYHSSRVDLAAGDLLVLFSDGITEAAGRQSRMVRSTGVAEAVLHGPRDSAAGVVRAVMAALQPGGAAVSDDRTLLVVRLPG